MLFRAIPKKLQVIKLQDSTVLSPMSLVINQPNEINEIWINVDILCGHIWEENDGIYKKCRLHWVWIDMQFHSNYVSVVETGVVVAGIYSGLALKINQNNLLKLSIET